MWGIITELCSTLFGGVDDARTGYTLIYNVADAFCSWDTGQTTAYSFVETIYTTVVPAALALALCFLVLGILEAVTRYGFDNITINVLAVPLLQFLMCVILIKYGLQIASYIMAGSNWLVQHMGAEELSATLPKMELAEQTGLLGKLVINFFITLLALATQISAAISIAYQIISIKIEFLIRVAFMPIAIADVAQGGVHGAGMRYLKRLIVNMFMLMGILATIKLTFATINMTAEQLTIFDATKDAGQVLNSILGCIFVAAVGPMASVGAVGSFKAALNEMFG